MRKHTRITALALSILLVLASVTALSAASAQKARLLGDADGNGDVESIDAPIIMRYCAMISIYVDEDTLMNGDVNSDEDLDIIDATFIQRYLCLMDVPYPIGEYKY